MSTTLKPVSAEQLNLQLRVNRFRAPDLVRDYVDAAPGLAPFFAGFPWDRTALTRTAERVAARFDAQKRQAMAGAIRGTTDAAREKLKRGQGSSRTRRSVTPGIGAMPGVVA